MNLYKSYALNEDFASGLGLGEVKQVKGILLFHFFLSDLFFQVDFMVHEEKAMLLSDFGNGGRWGGLRGTYIDFCKSLGRSKLGSGRERGTAGWRDGDLAGKLLLPSQK